MSEKYRNIETNEIVKIVDDSEQFYLLNNGMKINKQLFTKKYAIINNSYSDNTIDANQFLNQKTNINNMKIPNTANQQQIIKNESFNNIQSDVIDPNSFFNSIPEIKGLQNLDNFKNIDTSKIIDIPNSQTIVDRQNEQITSSNVMEEEKRRLLEKYNGQQAIPEHIEHVAPVHKVNPENGLTENQEYLRKEQIFLNGIDPYADKVAKWQKEHNINQSENGTIIINNEEKVVASIDYIQPIDNKSETIVNNDPVYSFFKSAKRNHDIKIKVTIDDKIGNPDFIKMMSENLDGDFIEYYAEDILKTFLNNTTKLKKLIYDEVKKEIFGKEMNTNLVNSHITTNENVKKSIETLNKISENILIPGKKTKTGQQTYQYINEKGKIVEMLKESAEKKGYKPNKK